jgi:hypothetical protein
VTKNLFLKNSPPVSELQAASFTGSLRSLQTSEHAVGDILPSHHRSDPTASPETVGCQSRPLLVLWLPYKAYGGEPLLYVSAVCKFGSLGYRYRWSWEPWLDYDLASRVSLCCLNLAGVLPILCNCSEILVMVINHCRRVHGASEGSKRFDEAHSINRLHKLRGYVIPNCVREQGYGLMWTTRCVPP